MCEDARLSSHISHQRPQCVIRKTAHSIEYMLSVLKTPAEDPPHPRVGVPSRVFGRRETAVTSIQYMYAVKEIELTFCFSQRRCYVQAPTTACTSTIRYTRHGPAAAPYLCVGHLSLRALWLTRARQYVNRALTSTPPCMQSLLAHARARAAHAALRGRRSPSDGACAPGGLHPTACALVPWPRLTIRHVATLAAHGAHSDRFSGFPIRRIALAARIKHP